MKLLPTCRHFQIIDPPVEPTSLFLIQFIYSTHLEMARKQGSKGASSYDVAFSYIGELHSERTKARLMKIGGLLHSRGIRYVQTVARVKEKEYRRLDAEQRLNRKKSRLYNLMQQKRQLILEKNGLFMEEELAALAADYTSAIEKLDSNYSNQINQ